MNTLRHVMLGLTLAALGTSGCAERPGKKKDDDKADKADKKEKKGDAAGKDPKADKKG